MLKLGLVSCVYGQAVAERLPPCALWVATWKFDLRLFFALKCRRIFIESNEQINLFLSVM